MAPAGGHQQYSLRMGGGRSGPDRTGLSPWGTRLLAAVLLALAVSLAWAYMQNYYRGVSAGARLSYSPNDLPVLPHDHLVYDDPIFGHHYFGDYQVPLSYARDLRDSLSPYLRPAPE